MSRCRRCSSEISDLARYCSSCGAEQSSASQAPTAVAAQPTSPTVGRLDASASSAVAAFASGQLLAERYRIIGLIGRGGMGEVYRADDLKLGQAVSLKFLPPALASRAGFVERFHAEVRNARQVSHPNVCRVYDIGEIDGQQFISMEYVDGEDLATLLRRIGRLPRGKADEVGRQLCAGLAAAHDKGVLHRDLKPSNVMLDGEGRVRITDFGLAIRADDAAAGEVAGTPAYMSPEQFEGKPVSVQSDLYSLGLILYEVYTGHRAFDARTFADWKSRHTTTIPTSPAQVEGDISDAAERVIMRCLEKDPSQRPASALQIAAALPGGDPLAAALAAGETPSPEMVAAAGGEGALSPRTAWTLLGAVAALLAAVLAIAPYSTDLGLAPLKQSMAVLKDRARGIVARLGYDADPRDSDAWLSRRYAPMKYLSLRKPSPVWRRELRRWGAPVYMTYRQSPSPLVPQNSRWRVNAQDPPMDVPGMVTVALDASQRLWAFQAVPPRLDSLAGAPNGPSWDELFTAAQLDRGRFTEVPPRSVPPFAFDSRAEWVGPAPWAADVPLQVSAAAWRGRPVSFEVRGPWETGSALEPQPLAGRIKFAQIFLTVCILVLTGFGLLLARRNLRLGRGDRRGAVRIGLAILCLGLLRWVLSAHHVSSITDEFGLYFSGFGQALTLAVLTAILYLAVEPFVRRRMPELLIGWARVLDGRFTDPRVGRDMLFGAMFGALAGLTFHVTNGLPTWFPLGGQTPIPADMDFLAGGWLLPASLLIALRTALLAAMALFGGFFLMLLLLRKRAAAIVGLAILLTLSNLGGENFALETPGAILSASLIAVLVARHGLLAAVAGTFVAQLLFNAPLPVDGSTPYAANAIVLLLGLAALVVYAFRVSLGPRPVFKLALDD